MTRQIERLMVKIGILIAFSVLFYTALEKLDFVLERADRFLFFKAVNECGEVASVVYETEEGKVKTKEPFKPAYEQCLRDKGIK